MKLDPRCYITQAYARQYVGSAVTPALACCMMGGKPQTGC
jgi:hypothetical protein